MRPWRMASSGGGATNVGKYAGRLDLQFTPFVERVAESNLLVIASVVHQMFGFYSGTVQADDGERIHLDELIGFAEEHHARW
jgi:hypothetical protein